MAQQEKYKIQAEQLHEEVDQNTDQFEIEQNNTYQIDAQNDRYPYCIVWTILPFISWFLPIIGHTGICSSDGIIHDFAGPYTISIDNLAFGKTLKYVKLDLKKMKKDVYNQAVLQADKKYSGEMHNLFCNNCHSHVAYALNKMEYKGKTNWTMFGVFWLCIAESTYVDSKAILKTYCGFAFMIFIYILFKLF